MRQTPPPVTVRRSRVFWHLALIALVALWVAVPGLDFRSIENYEHPRFARIAQTILWDGEWIALRYGGAPYTSKPPLLMWLIALISAPFGHVNPWTARLPSACASFVGALATYGIGHRLANRQVGLWAALILLTSWKWTWYAHSITTDMLLCGGIAVMVYCIVRAWLADRPGLWWYAAGVAAGLASLAKGPIGLLVPIVAAGGAWIALGRDRPRIAPAAGWLPVGFALAFTPWVLLLADRIGWDQVWAIVDREIVHRATSPTGQAEPFWHYAKKLPGDILPWSLLWPALAVCARPSRVPPAWRRAVWLGLSWALIPIVLFSLSRGKASRYILCTYPGWALLCGLVVQRVFEPGAPLSRFARRLVEWPMLSLAVALLVTPLVLWLPISEPPYREVLRVAAGIGTGLALMGTYLLIVHRGTARLRVAFGIIITSACLVHALHLRLLGVVDDERSPYKVAALRVRTLAAGRPIATFPEIDHRLNYYFADAPLPTVQALRDRVMGEMPVACVVLPDVWAQMESDVQPWIARTYDVLLVERRAVVALSKAGAPPDSPAAILPSVAPRTPAGEARPEATESEPPT